MQARALFEPNSWPRDFVSAASIAHYRFGDTSGYRLHLRYPATAPWERDDGSTGEHSMSQDQKKA